MRMTMMAALTVLALAGEASPAAADVTLMRGSFVETVSTGRSAAPAVLRGARALPASAVTPPAPVEATAPAGVVTGGSVLWQVDEANHDVRACWLQGTGAPGEYFIRCSTR